MADLLTVTDRGLYCPPGDFYIDPWLPVDRAVITHAHSDHARAGSGSYLTAWDGVAVLRQRLGPEAVIEEVNYAAALDINGVRVSLHPAGHILGSAQVRVEYRGDVWVVSGDYKCEADPTCRPFEPVACRVFVTESTFGLPIYRWTSPGESIARLADWWRENRAQGVVSVVFAYALGKAQRILASLPAEIGPIYCHGAVDVVNAAYRAQGVALPAAPLADRGEKRKDWDGALIVAPPSADGSTWLRKFGDISTAFASGWMLVRGMRRRRAVDRGFVISDHADWGGLCDTIRATGAERVLVTHGFTGAMTRYWRERGYEAAALATRYEGEQDETAGEAA